jgi:hypothetical protein
MGDPHQHNLLMVAAHGVFLDVANAGDIPLPLGHARLELRSRLDCEQRVSVGAIRTVTDPPGPRT